MNLRLAILDAAPGLKVKQVVQPAVLARLSPKVRRAFETKEIEWGDDRGIWGLSFSLRDSGVRIGHRKGDHIAQHPKAHGMSDQEASRILCLHIEGVLLHELGHAILDTLDQEDLDYFAQMASNWDPVSTYEGHGDTSTAVDVFHERFADAFRWWVTNPNYIKQLSASWAALCKVVLDSAEAALR